MPNIRHFPAAENEHALVASACTGDRAAYGELYAHYKPYITRYFQRRSLQPADVEDLVSETFTKSLERTSEGTRIRDFGPWIYYVARGVLTSYFREITHTGKSAELSPHAEALYASSMALSSHDVPAEITPEAYEPARHLLPEMQRNVMDMVIGLHDRRWKHNGIYAEIARTLGIKENTARVYAHRARNSIKKSLSEKKN